jgi:hypothetical protein
MVEKCSWRGTNTGEITAPDGNKIPPTGKTINIIYCFNYEFKNESPELLNPNKRLSQRSYISAQII